MEEALKQRYKIGDEVRVDFLGRVSRVEILKDARTEKERVVYQVEGNYLMRAYNLEDFAIVPLPEPEEVQDVSRER